MSYLTSIECAIVQKDVEVSTCVHACNSIHFQELKSLFCQSKIVYIRVLAIVGILAESLDTFLQFCNKSNSELLKLLQYSKLVESGFRNSYIFIYFHITLKLLSLCVDCLTSDYLWKFLIIPHKASPQETFISIGRKSWHLSLCHICFK